MNLKTIVVSVALGSLLASPALARDNDGYGETRWNNLPLKGHVSKPIWVGSWWAYSHDGIAYRVHDSAATSGIWDWQDYGKKWTRWDSRALEDLSPAEKYDHLVGRADKIDYDALIERAKKVDELREEVSTAIERRRELVRVLNKMIKDNSGDPSFNWQDTDEGKEYVELGETVDEKNAEVAALPVDIDTAFEWEVLSHGSAQFGLDSWFGHCNAWAAAAIMEPEPRRSTVVDGIEFTGGDVKAYLTELWMEQHSSFHGSRNNYHESEEARDAIDFKDVTPAAFHIFFADQIGNRDKSFVIDRYTGSQVWNQPTKAYRAKAEALYSTDAETGEARPMEREVVYTKYGYNGASLEERGKMEVYPVLVTTTIHWVTDGLPHETLTLPYDANIDDETFADHHDIEALFDKQIEMRTLTYEIWLDKPMDDPEARIVGDGQWEHGSATGYAHLHPDFMWQPIANVNNSRDYENELIDYDKVVQDILPGTLEPADDPEVDALTFRYEGSAVDIPDADKANPATASLEVDVDLPIQLLTVTVDISHTYIGDLQIQLTGPSGTVAILKPFGDGGGADDVKKTYDVKEFDGEPARGTWTLSVADQWRQDTGAINTFSLDIK